MRPLVRTTALLAAGVLAAGLTGCGTGSSPGAASSGPSSSGPSSGASATPASPTGPATPTASGTPGPTANGIAGASDEKVLAEATAAFERASSVHVAGEAVSGGTKIVLDLRAARDRTGRGSVTLGPQRIDVIVTDKAVYLGGNDVFWTESAGKGAASLFRGKFIKTTRSAPEFAGIASFFDLADFSKNLLPHDNLAGNERTTVRGVPARLLRDGGDARYTVATVGEPYPLTFSGSDGKDRVDLTFDRYGETIDLTPPPADKVVDAADLKK